MEKKKIIFASSNKNKIREVNKILSNFEILSLEDIGFFDEIEENGKTFEDNSKIKANTVKEYIKKQNINLPIIADDSGLCVNALNGEPGVYSARYSGEYGNNKANREKLLSRLKDKKDRSAYFITVVTYIDLKDNVYTFEGKTHGYILEKEGANPEKFAYDCLFFSNDLNKCFGEASQEEKNTISHRKRALEKLEDFLNEKK